MDAELLQIVSINIGGHRHTRQEPLDLSRLADQVRQFLDIKPEQPTIIALQEANRLWDQNNRLIETGALLAEALGGDYRAYFAGEVDSLTLPHRQDWDKDIYEGFSRAAEGNGIVTNLPLAHWPWPYPRPNHPGHGNFNPIATVISRATLYSTGERRTQPRNLFIASLESTWGPLFFMTTHLATFRDEDRTNPDHPITRQASDERLFQADQILTVVQELRLAEQDTRLPQRPIILVGDFNAEPDTPEMQAFTPLFRLLQPRMAGRPGEAPWTHGKYHLHVDHVLTNDPARQLGALRDCYILPLPPDNAITDHQPVLAIFDSQER